MAVARRALADHRAIEDIERRKQHGRAMADAIVGHLSIRVGKISRATNWFPSADICRNGLYNR